MGCMRGNVAAGSTIYFHVVAIRGDVRPDRSYGSGMNSVIGNGVLQRRGRDEGSGEEVSGPVAADCRIFRGGEYSQLEGDGEH